MLYNEGGEAQEQLLREVVEDLSLEAFQVILEESNLIYLKISVLAAGWVRVDDVKGPLTQNSDSTIQITGFLSEDVVDYLFHI